jgi:hypothetical protein
MRHGRLATLLALGWTLAVVPARCQAAPPGPPDGTTAAAHRRQRVEAVAALHRERGMTPVGPQCCNILQIPAAAFVPWSSAVTYAHDANGYLHGLTLGGDLYQFWAPVTLPSGTEIVYLDLYYYNNTSANIVCTQFSLYHGGSLLTGPPADYFFTGVCSPGSFPGYGVAESAAFTYTVNNDAEFDGSGGQLVVKIELGTNSADLAFKGVDVWYTQQVSPAPASPTFNDVPVSDPAFQFIEALAVSQITVGCGGGNYCPDAPLTRRQMAVFLAKAFGLYWPY